MAVLIMQYGQFNMEDTYGVECRFISNWIQSVIYIALNMYPYFPLNFAFPGPCFINDSIPVCKSSVENIWAEC